MVRGPVSEFSVWQLVQGGTRLHLMDRTPQVSSVLVETLELMLPIPISSPKSCRISGRSDSIWDFSKSTD